MTATLIPTTGLAMPSLAAQVETRIVRIKYAPSHETIIAVLCEQLKEVTANDDIRRLVDVAERRASAIKTTCSDECALKEALA